EASPGLAVTVLPNGSDRKFWRVAPQRRDSPIMAVSAMRLNRRKRPLALLRAFHQAQAIAKERRLILRVAGTGPGVAAMRRYIRRHRLQDDVTLLGVLSRDALRELYSQAHIFVLP